MNKEDVKYLEEDLKDATKALKFAETDLIMAKNWVESRKIAVREIENRLTKLRHEIKS